MRFFLLAAFISILLMTNVNAASISIDEDHPIKTFLTITQNQDGHLLSQPLKKEITLMNIKLTPKQKREFFSYKPSSFSNLKNTGLPTKADVGMNGVPVLDQGVHGTCTTFAVTAALDSMLGKGDYISQLCNLSLGRYLKSKGYFVGGWNGIWGAAVLDQISRFGVVSTGYQKESGCAGVTEYPLHDDEDTGNVMKLDDFKLASEDILGPDNKANILNITLLSFGQRFDKLGSDTVNLDNLLLSVKKILAVNDPEISRSVITFAVFLPQGEPVCSVGACAKHNAMNDTWVLTDYIKANLFQIIGGHSMVITGYDDDAIAIDNNGTIHKGLLTLRNSWGPNAGDHGNYYMSYDFFTLYVTEINHLLKANENSNLGE